MDQEIRITAEPKDLESCKFTVSRPVYAGGSVYFGRRDRAVGSPLAERIFDIPGVVAVLIQDNVVTVTTDGTDDWRTIGKQIGGAIRSVLQSDAPPISPKALAQAPPADEIRQKIQALFDDQINPAIAAHGGWVEVIDVKDNEVYLRLGGGCQGCGAADVTLKQGIEKSIRQLVPEVGAIMDTTDHAAGRNPYYAPSEK
jgi:Fe-S cluster biogenesis protein NfuA